MLTLETIKKDTIWVVKMQGWRTSGTWDEVERYADDEECRDIDISANQPTEELKEFWDELYDHEGFITVDDFYPIYVEKHSKQKRIWTEEEIKELVQTNDKVLYGALRNLYACQTAEEQSAGYTKEYNGMGFNGVDAPILSSFCEFLNKTGFLTPKQKVVARKKLVKYNKQLTKLANAS